MVCKPMLQRPCLLRTRDIEYHGYKATGEDQMTRPYADAERASEWGCQSGHPFGRICKSVGKDSHPVERTRQVSYSFACSKARIKSGLIMTGDQIAL
jgi:hypothetical protein